MDFFLNTQINNYTTSIHSFHFDYFKSHRMYSNYMGDLCS